MRQFIRPKAWLVCVFCSLSAMLGCASNELYRMGSEPDAPENVNLNSAAYAADGFTFSKRMRIRSPNDSVFYFKACNQVNGRVYYSKTDYDCTYP